MYSVIESIVVGNGLFIYLLFRRPRVVLGLPPARNLSMYRGITSRVRPPRAKRLTVKSSIKNVFVVLTMWLDLLRDVILSNPSRHILCQGFSTLEPICI